MNAARGSTVALAGAATALLLAACTPAAPPPDPTGSQTAAPGPTATETPSAEPSEPSPTSGGPSDAVSLPPGFPDPASLIGGELTMTFSDTGSTTLVDGQDTGLVDVFGACFGGTGDHVCDWSIQGSAQAGEGGIPEPTQVSLLMLLRNAGMDPDGSVTWTVVDALAVAAPGGEPALLQYCQGEDGIAFYPDPSATADVTIPAAAAWGSNADRTALVPVDPASVSCEAFGD